MVIFFVKESYVRKDDQLIEPTETKSYLQLIKDRSTLVVILLYSVEALIQCSFDSLISLWLSAKHEDGGFGLTIKEIGWMISLICPMQAGNCICVQVCFT